MIAFASAGGLGLPDRDYYLKDDAKIEGDPRRSYVAHVGEDARAARRPGAAARARAATVLRIETALAKASLTRVERRDPYKLLPPDDAHAAPGAHPLASTGTATSRRSGSRGSTTFNVTEPKFFQELEAQLEREPPRRPGRPTSAGTLARRARRPASRTPSSTANFDFYRRRTCAA